MMLMYRLIGKDFFPNIQHCALEFRDIKIKLFTFTLYVRILWLIVNS
jgi:hypothetical protein